MWIGQPHCRDGHTATLSSPFVERAPNGRGLFSFINDVLFLKTVKQGYRLVLY